MGSPKRKEEETPLSTAQGASSLIPSEGSNCFYSPDLTGSDFHFQQIGAYPRHAQRHARYPQASLGASIVPGPLEARVELSRRPSWALLGEAQHSGRGPALYLWNWELGPASGLVCELPKPPLLSIFLHLSGFHGPLSSVCTHMFNCLCQSIVMLTIFSRPQDNFRFSSILQLFVERACMPAQHGGSKLGKTQIYNTGSC